MILLCFYSLSGTISSRFYGSISFILTSGSFKMLTVLIELIVHFVHDIIFSAWYVSNYFISACWTHIASFNERKMLVYVYVF